MKYCQKNFQSFAFRVIIDNFISIRGREFHKLGIGLKHSLLWMLSLDLEWRNLKKVDKRILVLLKV